MEPSVAAVRSMSKDSCLPVTGPAELERLTTCKYRFQGNFVFFLGHEGNFVRYLDEGNSIMGLV